MSDIIKENVILKMIEANMYALQVEESTDIGGKAQLFVYTRFMDSGKNIIEQLLCYKEFERTTTGADVLDVLDQYLSSVGMSWETCVGIYRLYGTDDAPIYGRLQKGLSVSWLKKNKIIVLKHCFIYREAFVAKVHK